MEKIINSNEPTKIWNKNFTCVFLANFMLCMAHFSVNPLVATYAEFLDANPGVIGLLAGMFFGVALAMRPFAGPISTKVDKRKLLIFVFILGAVANLGYAVFPYIPAFVVFRVIHGIQFSLVGMILLTLSSDHLPKTRMVSGLGMFGAGGAIASAIAPSIGDGLLNLGTGIRDEYFGFAMMFMFGAVIFVLAIVPTLILDPDRKTKEDIASTGAWYKNIFTIHALPPTIIVFLLIIPNAIIHTYMFDFGREQGIEGISIFYLVLALTLAASRPIFGMLTDKVGLVKTMFPGFLILAVSFLVIGTAQTLAQTIVGAVIGAIGFGATQPSLQVMCMQMETPLKRSVASNTLYIGLDLGLFLGPILGGFVREVSNLASMLRFTAIPVALAMIGFAIILPIYHRRVKALYE